MVMIRVVSCQNGGSFPILFWDPMSPFLDSSITIRDLSINFYFLEFTFGRTRSGFLEEWYSKELAKFM
jgi:hypothetical protein